MSDPVVARKSPFAVEMEAGRSYWWCSCGRSQGQPFCDGSHKETEEFPVVLTIFMGGMAGGAWLVSRISHRIKFLPIISVLFLVYALAEIKGQHHSMFVDPALRGTERVRRPEGSTSPARTRATAWPPCSPGTPSLAIPSRTAASANSRRAETSGPPYTWPRRAAT